MSLISRRDNLKKLIEASLPSGPWAKVFLSSTPEVVADEAQRPTMRPTAKVFLSSTPDALAKKFFFHSTQSIKEVARDRER